MMPWQVQGILPEREAFLVFAQQEQADLGAMCRQFGASRKMAYMCLDRQEEVRMRVLLSTIGSRGDVQPLVALALKLRELGQVVRLCVPPDFQEWIAGLGFSVTPIGPELRGTAKPNPGGAMPTAEQRRQMIAGTVQTQFATITAAAQGCDVIVGATALQIAAPSIAEAMGIPCVFVAYCPAVLPSPHHAPPVLTPAAGTFPSPGDYRELWDADAQRWKEPWQPLLNAQRAALGLAPVSDVRSHVLTTHPWLAADPSLAPWPDLKEADVWQSGAWLVPDTRPLSPEIEAFLAEGEPPIYVGFGSIRAPETLSEVMIASARALGRRAIVSRGWAELALLDDAPDCLLIAEVNQQALFPRVAAAVHHGGAGTTTAAAMAGAPQVVIPQHYDQFYWAQRMADLGIGAALSPGAPAVASLTDALARALHPEVAVRAQSLSSEMVRNGASVAACRLLEVVQQHSS